MADQTEAEAIAERIISRAKHAGTYVEPKFVLVEERANNPLVTLHELVSAQAAGLGEVSKVMREPKPKVKAVKHAKPKVKSKAKKRG